MSPTGFRHQFAPSLVALRLENAHGCGFAHRMFAGLLGPLRGVALGCHVCMHTARVHRHDPARPPHEPTAPTCTPAKLLTCVWPCRFALGATGGHDQHPGNQLDNEYYENNGAPLLL